MSARGRKITSQFGHADIGVSRYFALYLAQAGWVALGLYLYSQAIWPSTCTPHGLVEIYMCSGQLADNRGWVEAALMTWLWTTPLLLALAGMELLRRMGILRSDR
ncbi:hypothetical protein FHS61_001241 [Altererythrobacter atlanticus]|nr:hypothetical protein [Croceibacterium atlanticum]MBB5732237.1 hypothetical protein [Croceibacterium atlanticum]